ncbi:MAG: 16S rRNA (adenine(1518)-N(6)/adenine(1519)-N(6))-dimethyltransferase RsmA, partial [Desulfatiglandales bacterium]
MVHIHPKRCYGQNFLVNKGAVERIVDVISGYGPSHVLEIGPGRGEITIPLSFRVPRITAVEIDPELSRILRDKIEDLKIENIHLVQGDFLAIDILPLTPKGTLVMGNLPYRVSTPILQRVEKVRDNLMRAVFMLQKEVAERISASPGSKAYGSLSVLIQYNARVRVLMRLKRGSFWPTPQVDSAIVEIDYQRPYPIRVKNEELFRDLVKGIFFYRRKTLLNSLRYLFG